MYSRDNGARSSKRDCYVIQFRDGSLLRDEQGRIQFRYSMSAARKLYLDLLRIGVQPPSRRPSRHRLDFFARQRAANFPQIIAAADCSETQVTPITSRFFPPSVPRPHPDLSPTDETALRLLARARQSEAARQVAHDYLLEHYPEYRERIAEAGGASRRWHQPWTPIAAGEQAPKKTIRHDQIVYIHPVTLVSTFQFRWRNPSRTAMRRQWGDTVVIVPLEQGKSEWVKSDRRGWIPIFRVPAAQPRERDRNMRYGYRSHRDVGDLITIRRGKRQVRVQVLDEDAKGQVVGDDKGRVFRITKKHHQEVLKHGPAFVDSVVKLTKDNRAFRRVAYTSSHMQLVLMSLRPGERIGGEVHKGSDEFYRVEIGEGAVVVGRRRIPLGPGDAVLVPAGLRHDIINLSPKRALKLYVLSAPPLFPPGEVKKAKPSRRDEAVPRSERFVFPSKRSADIFEYKLRSEGYSPRRMNTAVVAVRAPGDVVRTALGRSRTYARDTRIRNHRHG